LRRAGTREKVVKHCCTVAAVAIAIAEECGADVGTVRAGALLHDLGRARTHGPLHCVASEEMIRELGLPDELAKIAGEHMGAGFTSEEAVAMGLPPGDRIPSTLESKIVCHADNLVWDDRVARFEETLADAEERGYANTVTRLKAMHAELSALCGRDVSDVAADAVSSGSLASCLRLMDRA